MSEKICPICSQPLKIVPAGTSKNTGKDYPAFYACNNKCNLRGKMDTRVVTDDRPKGWEQLGEKLGKQALPRDINSDLEIHAKLDRILSILSKNLGNDEDLTEETF